MSNNFYMYLSIFLFCVSIYIYRRTGSSAKNRFFFSSTVFASIVFYLIYAISNYFTGDGIDKSVIYHVRYGLGGAGFSEYWELITASIVFIILGGFFSYWIPLGRVKNTANRTGYVYASYALILLSLLFNPAISEYIITDVKTKNIEALKIFSEALPDFKKRIIPQIYNPDNFDKVKKMGYEQIIWTLYRYNGTNDDVLDSVSKFKGPIAITMPKIRAMSTLPRELAKKNIPTYVHTINSIDEMNKFITHSGVTEIYTDFIHVEN